MGRPSCLRPCPSCEPPRRPSDPLGARSTSDGAELNLMVDAEECRLPAFRFRSLAPAAKARFPPSVMVAQGGSSATLRAQMRPLLSFDARGPNEQVGQRAASGFLAAGLVIFQRISRSPAVVPAAIASTNHCGLHPRPDQVMAGLSGCWYFGATGALNRPGFTGDCLVLLKRLYQARSGLHSMPPLPQLV